LGICDLVLRPRSGRVIRAKFNDWLNGQCFRVQSISPDSHCTRPGISLYVPSVYKIRQASIIVIGCAKTWELATRPRVRFVMLPGLFNRDPVDPPSFFTVSPRPARVLRLSSG